jgi:hypothetical protein
MHCMLPAFARLRLVYAADLSYDTAPDERSTYGSR